MNQEFRIKHGLEIYIGESLREEMLDGDEKKIQE